MALAERWNLANLIPIAFILWVAASTQSIYFVNHLWTFLEEESLTRQGLISRGRIEATIAGTLVVMFSISFLRAMFTNPGVIEATGQEVLTETKSAFGPAVAALETKRSGERRFCKWCKVYKSDRAHHCRVCKACILRMDHHCPWISNCVGFQNHKYFMLLVFYSLATSVFNIATMSRTVSQAFTKEMHSSTRFLLVFGTTTLSIMLFILVPFITFHAWLMLTATTTIEFCEKTTRGKGGLGKSRYSQGVYKNICAVLGDNPLLWLLPLCPAAGDGRSFPVDEVPDESSLLQSRASGSGTFAENCSVRADPEVTGAKAALV